VKTLARVSLPTIAVVLVLTAACGGKEQGTPVSSATPTGGRPATVASVTSTDASATVPSTPVPGDARATLVDLFSRGLNTTYKVTYQTSAPDGNKYIVSNRPPLTRIDAISPGSSSPFSSVIGTQGSATVDCSGGPDSWECSQTPAAGESLLVIASPVIFPTASEVDFSDVRETEARTIAGQAARCFRLRPPQGGADKEIEYCLNSDGVPLFSAGSFGTTQAIEFSVDVSSEDFVPPVEPQQ
jgi:hypothetical protein